MPKKGFKHSEESKQKMSRVLMRMYSSKNDADLVKEESKKSKRLYDKEHIKNHPDQRKVVQRRYRKNHPNEIKKEYVKNKESQLKQATEWAKKNPKKRSEIMKRFRIKHPDRARELIRNHYYKFPERKLENSKRYLIKCGFPLKMDPFAYSWAINSWSQAIRKINSNECQCCPNKAVISHHIIHKAKYPALSLNVNNGISLCLKCHYEVHGWKILTMTKFRRWEPRYH